MITPKSIIEGIGRGFSYFFEPVETPEYRSRKHGVDLYRQFLDVYNRTSAETERTRLNEWMNEQIELSEQLGLDSNQVFNSAYCAKIHLAFTGRLPAI